ncbi:Ferric/cupric reductase transmembrane component 1 [Mycena venus]|uniref:Ferric/cupric reductase transmembrane component 1 n=1 Tax=Mycena venus TaxID=2733690 RepID=A0A8H6X9H9_9AGAR|nr:Ferric/cupric reductase transmembrane component 1 [Mycena venus]
MERGVNFRANLSSILDAAVDAKKAAPVNPDKAPSIQRNYDYPKQIWYLLASFIALVSIYHFTTLFVARLCAPKAKSVPAGGRGRLSLIRCLPLAVVHVFRTVAFRITASFGSYTLNVAEFFLACGYITAIFTWEFVNTTDLEGERFSLRYYANRAGHIAATQFPLLIALGMKNNIIGFLTGISFDKLNLLHRVVARVLCVVLWIHAGGRLKQNGAAENMQDFGEAWFRWGFVSVTALTMLCFLSVRPLRKRGYEMFIVAHFFVAVILLVGSFIHTKNQKTSRFVWPSFVLWGVDRLLRLLRIFVVNGGYLNLLRVGKSATPLEACVDVISAHLLRVTVCVPDRVSWAPGQVAYLSIPAISRTPWEAHPFSISSIDPGSGASSGAKTSQNTSGTSSRDEKTQESESGEDAKTLVLPMTTSRYSKRKHLVFLIRVRGGFTKRLLTSAKNSESRTFKVYVDGPYGSPPPMTGFGTVLLFSGGSGVSFTLPLLLDLIRKSKAKTNPTCGRVVFVWAIRRTEQIRAISDLLSSCLDAIESLGLGLDIRIHVTTSEEDTEDDATSANTDVEKGGECAPAGRVNNPNKLLALPFVQLVEGRPGVEQIIRSEIGTATGAISVNVCGPRGLAQHVRRALCTATSVSDVLCGGPSVKLHVEAFGNE